RRRTIWLGLPRRSIGPWRSTLPNHWRQRFANASIGNALAPNEATILHHPQAAPNLIVVASPQGHVFAVDDEVDENAEANDHEQPVGEGVPIAVDVALFPPYVAGTARAKAPRDYAPKEKHGQIVDHVAPGMLGELMAKRNCWSGSVACRCAAAAPISRPGHAY